MRIISFTHQTFASCPSWWTCCWCECALTDKGAFSSLLSESSIAQIYQLIEFLSRSEPSPRTFSIFGTTDPQPLTAARLFSDLHVEGLFRVPGNSLRQQTLKELLNSGADVDLESGDFHPHDVASLLKSFLGELPEPLLTHRHFHAHLKIAGRISTRLRFHSSTA